MDVTVKQEPVMTGCHCHAGFSSSSPRNCLRWSDVRGQAGAFEMAGRAHLKTIPTCAFCLLQDCSGALTPGLNCQLSPAENSKQAMKQQHRDSP